MNKPLQVYLEKDDVQRLEDWAAEHGWTKSQAVRHAIRAVTARREGDVLLDAAGMIDGLAPDTSRRIDRYLEETFVAESSPKYQRGAGKRSGLRR